jgi:hypothetical protein
LKGASPDLMAAKSTTEVLLDRGGRELASVAGGIPWGIAQRQSWQRQYAKQLP